jgi:hypothetical protein
MAEPFGDVVTHLTDHIHGAVNMGIIVEGSYPSSNMQLAYVPSGLEG